MYQGREFRETFKACMFRFPNSDQGWKVLQHPFIATSFACRNFLEFLSLNFSAGNATAKTLEGILQVNSLQVMFWRETAFNLFRNYVYVTGQIWFQVKIF